MEIHSCWFARPDGSSGAGAIHGTGHTKRVRSHALAIADELEFSEWERQAIECAACWHDIGRTNDGSDYYHGAKSAGKVIGMELHLAFDPRVLEAALFAVTHHCGSETHAERSVGFTRDPDATLRIFRVLKDADALDRVRLRGGIDTSFLRYEVSHGLVQRAWQLLDELSV